jgi:glycosyltransferase involved in cell wall biosynthesis
LLAPPGESRPLSVAICRLLASPELARRLGRAGRRWVEEHFDERHQTAETEMVYEKALHLEREVSTTGVRSEGRLAS